MAKFQDSCNNHQSKQNMRGRRITDLKKAGALQVFFATNPETQVQALWHIFLPVRITGVKKDGKPYDFVMNSRPYIHPGIDLSNTENIPEPKMCSWTQLFKYLKENDSIAEETVILQVGNDTFNKAQILGKWINPNDSKANAFKYTISKPHGMFNKCHGWLFPVVDTREQAMLKVIELPYSLGGAIFDKVTDGITEDGEKSDPMINPHLYQLEYRQQETNPQKKYRVLRKRQETPTEATAIILNENLDTTNFIRPIEPQVVNKVIYDALVDKTLWDKIKENLLEEAQGIFSGDETEMKRKLGLLFEKKDEEKDDAQPEENRVRHGEVSTTTAQVVAPPVAGDYWMHIDGNSVKKSAEEVQQEVDSGNDKSPTMLVGETDWKTVADYGFKKTPVAPPVPPTTPSAPMPPTAPASATTRSGFHSEETPSSPQQQTSTNADKTLTCECGQKVSILDEECPQCKAVIDDVPF